MQLCLALVVLWLSRKANLHPATLTIDPENEEDLEMHSGDANKDIQLYLMYQRMTLADSFAGYKFFLDIDYRDPLNNQDYAVDPADKGLDEFFTSIHPT